MTGRNLSTVLWSTIRTRGITTDIPDPFGIEVGNPEEIPEGFEEKWLAIVHAIDTCGTEDKLGCTECRCELYNGKTPSAGSWHMWDPL